MPEGGTSISPEVARGAVLLDPKPEAPAPTEAYPAEAPPDTAQPVETSGDIDPNTPPENVDESQPVDPVNESTENNASAETLDPSRLQKEVEIVGANAIRQKIKTLEEKVRTRKKGEDPLTENEQALLTAHILLSRSRREGWSLDPPITLTDGSKQVVRSITDSTAEDVLICTVGDSSISEGERPKRQIAARKFLKPSLLPSEIK